MNLKAKLLGLVRKVKREYDEFSKGLKSFSVATNGFLGSPVIIAGTAFHLCTHNKLMDETNETD